MAIPKDWERARLSDIAEVNPKRVLKQGTVAPFIEMSNVNEDLPHPRRIASKQFDGGGAKFRNGDTLLARITPCAENGKTALVSGLGSEEIGFGSTEFIVLGERFEVSIPAYIYYLVKWAEVRSQLIQRMTGTSGRQRIPASALDEVVLGIPPLPEQKKIAAVLLSVDAAIEKTEAVIAQLQVVKKAMMEQLLTKGLPGRHTRFKQTELGEIPEEWEVETIRNLALHVTSGSRGWAEYYSAEGDAFIRSQNIRDGFFDLSDLAYVSQPESAEGIRTRVQPGDILITITGNNVGNAAVVPNTWTAPSYVSQHVGLVRLKDNLHADFTGLFLSPSGPGGSQLSAAQYGQSKPGLNLQSLRNLLVPIPTNQERASIVSVLRQFQSQIDLESVTLTALKSVKSSLSSSLLSGELRVPTDSVPCPV